MNRIDNYERMYLGENLEMPEAASRIDALWQAILNKEELPFEPVTRVEKYLAKMIDSSIETPNPTTRLEEILCAICNGEKLDAETKNACRDEYLKYIYELKSGENMFVPNNKPTKSGISYNGRTVTLNGLVADNWKAQKYSVPPVEIGETITVRYKYISGSILSYTGDYSTAIGAYGENGWAMKSNILLNFDNYKNEIVCVTEVTDVVKAFNIYVGANMNATFDNLTFEVSFEKGDTTK